MPSSCAGFQHGGQDLRRQGSVKAQPVCIRADESLPGCDLGCSGEVHGTLDRMGRFCRNIIAKTTCGPSQEVPSAIRITRNPVFCSSSQQEHIPKPRSSKQYNREQISAQVAADAVHEGMKMDRCPSRDGNPPHDTNSEKGSYSGYCKWKGKYSKVPHAAKAEAMDHHKRSVLANPPTPEELYPHIPYRGVSAAPKEDFNVDDLIIEKQVGRGAFGRVYKARLYRETVALKVISHSPSQPAAKVAPELELLHGICHPNIVHVKGVLFGMEGMLDSEEEVAHDGQGSYSSCFLSDFARQLPENQGGSGENSQTWVIMEFCNKGSLWDAVKRGDFRNMGVGSISYSKVMEVALEVAFAMQHLHEVGIIHGDLKAMNVMLQSSKSCPKNFVSKVGDFGLCRRMHGRKDITTCTWGTVDRMPPEVLQNGRVSCATDVFSFAMLLLEIITGDQPFKGMDTPAIIVGVVEGLRPAIPHTCPEPLAELIRLCWRQDWTQRPTFGAIVKMLRDIMFSSKTEAGAPSRPPSAIGTVGGAQETSCAPPISLERKSSKSGAWSSLERDMENARQRRLQEAWVRYSRSAMELNDVNYSAELSDPFMDSFSNSDCEQPGFHRVQEM